MEAFFSLTQVKSTIDYDYVAEYLRRRLVTNDVRIGPLLS